MKKLFYLFFALIGLTFAVSCGNPNPGPDQPVSNDLIITASERYILADGKAQTTFKVVLKGADVTSTAKIINYKESGSETLGAPSFTTSTTGIYQFYAIADGMFSEKISVHGVTMIPELPVDVMPAKFDGFKKRVAAMQATGLWCQFCPYTIAAIHEFEAKDAKADDVVFFAAHAQDSLTSVKSMELNDYYNMEGSYPMMFFELSSDKSRAMQTPQKASQIRDMADLILKTPATTGIALASKVVGDKICLSAEIKVGVAGALRIGAFLLQDDLHYKQVNSTPITDSYIDYHNHVVSNGYPEENLWEPLGGMAKVEANAKYKFHCEFDVKKSGIVNMEKTRVVVFVYNMDKGVCDNIVAAKVGAQTPYQYL